MKKILNDAESFASDAIAGVLAAHPGDLRSVYHSDRAIVRADAPVEGNVAIVTGGGTGHLPLFLGYVGRGLCHGVAIGNVFSSPSPDVIAAATEAVDGGEGVLYIYGNYSGDVLNFAMGAEIAAKEGIDVRSVVVADDVASAPVRRANRRRALGGLVFAYKVAGAKAEAGGSLEEVEACAKKAASNARSMGVALSPCIIPSEGEPTFELASDEMEMGIGIHGEQGVSRGPLLRADEIAELLVDHVMAELDLEPGRAVAVLVNGMGATPLEELYIVFRQIKQRLDRDGIGVHRTYVGEFMTSLEMAGCFASLLKLDEELTQLLDAPAVSPLVKAWCRE